MLAGRVGWSGRCLVLLSILPLAVGVALEATLIAVDNSPWMYNGDYSPTRVQNQYECVNLICQVKTQNPENTIGLMAMACHEDGCPEVLVTPAVNQDPGPILTTLYDANKKLTYPVQFEKAMKVGWLSLKRRMNKNQKPRIVAFVGSPLEIQDEPGLIQWGRKLRKNNVAVDVICFGEAAEQNTPTLQAFVDAVCKEGNSHLMTVNRQDCPAGGLSDLLFTSPILSESAEGAPAEDAAGSGQVARPPDYSEYGGINPELDPELAMALKMSAQEEQERIERERRQVQQNATSMNDTLPATAETERVDAQQSGQDAGEEDLELQQALRASLEGGSETGGAEANQGQEDDQMEDEQALLTRALELSLREAEQNKKEEK